MGRKGNMCCGGRAKIKTSQATGSDPSGGSTKIGGVQNARSEIRKMHPAQTRAPHDTWHLARCLALLCLMIMTTACCGEGSRKCASCFKCLELKPGFQGMSQGDTQRSSPEGGLRIRHWPGRPQKAQPIRERPCKNEACEEADMSRK